jgi:uncharacterized protein YjbI with pentapeptide repeats
MENPLRSDVSHSPRAPRPFRWRSWLQFRLRTLMALMLLVSIVGAWAVEQRAFYVRQRAALERMAYAQPELVPVPSSLLSWFIPRHLHVDVVGLRIGDADSFEESALAELRHFPKLRVLILDGAPVSNAGLAHLPPLKELQYLSLQRTKVTGAGLPHLKSLLELRALNLSDTRLRRGDLQQLPALPSLQELDLQWTQVDDADLDQLHRQKNLRQLTLRHAAIRGAGLAGLSRLPALEVLVASGPLLERAVLHDFPLLHHLDLQGPTLKSVELQRLPNLQSFSMVEPRSPHTIDTLSPPLALELRVLPQLQHLELARRRYSTVALEGLSQLGELKLSWCWIDRLQLAKLPQLQRVDFRGARLPSSSLRLQELTALAHLDLTEARETDDTRPFLPFFDPHSKCLDWQRAALPSSLQTLLLGSAADDGVVHLPDLPKLTTLSLRRCPVTDAALQKVKQFTELQNLSLAETRLSGASLQPLAGLTGLRRLELSGTDISDESVRALAVLPNLTHLALARTQVTDAGMKRLCECRQLEYLDICTRGVTEAGWKEVTSLPSLSLVVVDPLPQDLQRLSNRILSGPMRFYSHIYARPLFPSKIRVTMETAPLPLLGKSPAPGSRNLIWFPSEEEINPE